MHLPHLATLALAVSLSTASALLPRIITADTINQDVSNINAGVLANREATEAYQGGNILTTLVEGTPVLGTVGAIHIANRKGYADANLAPNFNEADTTLIFNHVVDTVGYSIPDDVQVLIGKKENFESSGLVPVVLASLKLLINDHDTFSAAVTAKSYQQNQTLNALGADVVAKIHNAIQNGIDVYSS